MAFGVAVGVGEGPAKERPANSELNSSRRKREENMKSDSIRARRKSQSKTFKPIPVPNGRVSPVCQSPIWSFADFRASASIELIGSNAFELLTFTNFLFR